MKDVRFIKDIRYPTWLANTMMVNKTVDKWSMCVDFIDLDKACPKDPYQLSSIDGLIYRASGFCILSFTNGYSDLTK